MQLYLRVDFSSPAQASSFLICAGDSMGVPMHRAKAGTCINILEISDHILGHEDKGTDSSRKGEPKQKKAKNA